MTDVLSRDTFKAGLVAEGAVTVPTTPVADTDAASKAYVDSQAGGSVILSGTATPDNSVGEVGDYYLDTNDNILYGPKALIIPGAVPVPTVVGITQDGNATLASVTLSAPAGVQDGDLLVALIGAQTNGSGASVIPNWKTRVSCPDGTVCGSANRWQQIVTRLYSADDPGPWTLPISATHTTQRKVATLVAVRYAKPATGTESIYGSATDTAVVMPIADHGPGTVLASWHGVTASPNVGTFVSSNGTLVGTKTFPAGTDGSVSRDWQHVLTRHITGADTITVNTTGPTIAAEATSAITLTPLPTSTAPANYLYSNVADMLSRSAPYYWAHRGGTAHWGEHTKVGYDQCVTWGAPVLEMSLARTSDGVWFGLHDQYLNRTSPSAAANYDPTAHTWAEVNAFKNENNVSTDPTAVVQPYLRLDTFLARYKDSGVLIVVDPKLQTGNTRWDELLDLILVSGAWPANRVIAKSHLNNPNWLIRAKGRGVATWGYLYDYDLSNPSLAAWLANADILGFNWDASAGDWTTVLGYGKKVIAHTILAASEATTALSRGAHGLMTGDIVNVVPRAPLPMEIASGSDPWPVALSSGSGGGGITEAEADDRYVVDLDHLITAADDQVTLDAYTVINNNLLMNFPNILDIRSTGNVIYGVELGSLKMPNDAANGFVLTSDAVGNATWAASTGGGGGLTEATADTLYLKLTGGTLTGALTLSADPASAMQPATRQYVDARTPKITVATTAPGSPAVGDIWVDSN